MSKNKMVSVEGIKICESFLLACAIFTVFSGGILDSTFRCLEDGTICMLAHLLVSPTNPPGVYRVEFLCGKFSKFSCQPLSSHNSWHHLWLIHHQICIHKSSTNSNKNTKNILFLLTLTLSLHKRTSTHNKQSKPKLYIQWIFNSSQVPTIQVVLVVQGTAFL